MPSNGMLRIPRKEGFLFGATTLILAALASGIAFHNRYRIWQLPVGRLTRILLVGGGSAADFVSSGLDPLRSRDLRAGGSG